MAAALAVTRKSTRSPSAWPPSWVELTEPAWRAWSAGMLTEIRSAAIWSTWLVSTATTVPVAVADSGNVSCSLPTSVVGSTDGIGVPS